MLLALAQFVEAHVQQAGNQLEPGIGLAVLAGAHVGGDRFGAQRGQPAVGIELVAQRRGEAFFRFAARDVAGVRLAVDDQAEHPLLAPEALELAHFLVDPARGRRVRRADHHQVGRLRQRLVDLAAEVVGAGQFVAIAEDRREFFRDRPGRGAAPDQALRDRIGLQRLVQPRAPATVLVAVADEGVVPALRHRRSPGEDGWRRTERMPWIAGIDDRPWHSVRPAIGSNASMASYERGRSMNADTSDRPHGDDARMAAFQPSRSPPCLSPTIAGHVAIHCCSPASQPWP